MASHAFPLCRTSRYLTLSNTSQLEQNACMTRQANLLMVGEDCACSREGVAGPIWLQDKFSIGGFLPEKLNSQWHERALQIFMAIV